MAAKKKGTGEPAGGKRPVAKGKGTGAAARVGKTPPKAQAARRKPAPSSHLKERQPRTSQSAERVRRQGLEWGDRTMGSREEMEQWLKERGGSWEEFAKKHPDQARALSTRTTGTSARTAGGSGNFDESKIKRAPKGPGGGRFAPKGGGGSSGSSAPPSAAEGLRRSVAPPRPPKGYTKKGKVYEDGSFSVTNADGDRMVYDPDTGKYRKPLR